MKIYKFICPICTKEMIGLKEAQLKYYVKQHYLSKHETKETPEINITEFEV